ncbi:MAG: MobA/MobL family protein [Oscillospiraceae bacterium]|nr:MobA/MobL family protein [Oscillospiraceae bacterium]
MGKEENEPEGAFSCNCKFHFMKGAINYAHIMLTVRPLNENSTWQHKTEKEYLCMKDGEERGFTAAEFKEAQKDGWEKQYQYKVGKKKEYMVPSAAEAQGLERTSKYPKSTKYGRQNPISERWNSDEQLVAWRAAWADEANLCLEQKGLEERIDHRSFADQGKDEQPTIHEGVAARALEKKGIVSDRCELNRQIKRDNALLRQLKAEFQKLMKVVQDSIPALAQAMEKLRANMIVFAYKVLHTGKRIKALTLDIDTDTPHIRKYDELSSHIREKQKELKSLSDKKAKTSFFQPVEHIRLNGKIDETIDEIKRLKSEKARETGLIGVADDAGVQRAKAMLEENLNARQAEQTLQARSKINLDLATQEFHDLEAQAAEFDPNELMDARLALRPEEESRAASILKETYTRQYDADTFKQTKSDVAMRLGEEPAVIKPRSLRENLRQKQKEVQQRELPSRKRKEKSLEI